MASSKGKLKKVLGPVSKVISVIPDTTEIINKTIDNTRPIIEKHMDQRHEKQMNLVKLDDVVNLPVDEAKAHLETLGFVVSRILVKTEAKYHNAQLNEVVRMSPTSSKEPKGSLVKLYYVDLSVIEQSQLLADEKTLKNVERNQKIADTLSSVKHIKLPFGTKK